MKRALKANPFLALVIVVQVFVRAPAAIAEGDLLRLVDVCTITLLATSALTYAVTLAKVRGGAR